MDAVGQATSAISARRRSSGEPGCWRTKERLSSPPPKVPGAMRRQVSQAMQVSSTKMSPGTFSGTARASRATWRS